MFAEKLLASVAKADMIASSSDPEEMLEKFMPVGMVSYFRSFFESNHLSPRYSAAVLWRLWFHFRRDEFNFCSLFSLLYFRWRVTIARFASLDGLWYDTSQGLSIELIFLRLTYVSH